MKEFLRKFFKSRGHASYKCSPIKHLRRFAYNANREVEKNESTVIDLRKIKNT